jgi:diguanylate cyclase (GGDEF)-like protein
MHLAQVIWCWLLSLLPGEVTPNETGWLVSPHLHMPLLAFRRSQMIVNRVRLFAALFAALTPLWIAVDMLTLPVSLWMSLALLRLLATAAFVALMLALPKLGRMRSAYRGMAALFAIPTVFYLVSHVLLSHYPLHGVSAAICAGYAFLPFVLLAGLAIFPLTLLENLLFALPVLSVEIAAFFFNLSSVGLPVFSGQLWLLSLLASVATLASMSQLAFIIALVNQTIHDPLTGTFSRRSGEELLELQIHYARRHNTPLAVAFFDLDHFKSINDQFGHEAGDRVLQQLNQCVMGQLRNGDIMIRWGGEEFLLLMPNTDTQQAVRALQRMLDHGLGMRPDGRPLTCSLGLAERTADKVESWKALVEIADARMYQAKREGRNRLVCKVRERRLEERVTEV